MHSLIGLVFKKLKIHKVMLFSISIAQRELQTRMRIRFKIKKNSLLIIKLLKSFDYNQIQPSLLRNLIVSISLCKLAIRSGTLNFY